MRESRSADVPGADVPGADVRSADVRSADVRSADVCRVDVLVVGAGISGIGAAYRLQTEHPRRTYAILDGRDAIGGTWDLFRYPGIRSDSDMFTLGYPFRPWTGEKSIAEGDTIRRYLVDTAAEYGIDRKIFFGREVVAASWSSREQRWSVEVRTGDRDPAGGGTERWSCAFLFLGSGYYSYDRGYTPDIPGLASFAGELVHPQEWPADLDVAGRRVVVVGSGATAVTLVPALVARGAHVTMVQRSPTWIVSAPGTDALANSLRARMPGRLGALVPRWKNIVLTQAFYQFCQRFPGFAARMLRRALVRQLPDPAMLDRDFTPRYGPWDQRLCLVPDGDLFAALRSGAAEVVTDVIAEVTEKGVTLRSGRTLDADVLVTATGLKIVAAGGIAITVDGTAIDPGATVAYRGCLLSGVPNLAMSIGYINASWTLRSDLVARYVCRLLAHMDAAGYAVAVPRTDATVAMRPLMDLSSGYLERAAATLPKQGAASPWRLRPNYLRDRWEMERGDIGRDMEFTAPVAAPAPAPAAV